MFNWLKNTVIGLAHGAGRLTIKQARRFNNDKDGVAAVELAFIFPIMLVLYFGLVDVSNLLSANRRVALTSNTIADLVTQASGTVTQSELQGFFNAASPVMDPLDATAMGLELFSYELDAGGTAQLLWEKRNAGGISCGATPAATTEMVALMQAGTGLIMARTCYTWTPLSGYVIGSLPVTVSDEMILRPRQSSSIVCTDCP